MTNRGVPSSAVEIMIGSLSDNTVRQYDVCIKRWYNYAINNEADLYKPSLSTILDFLTDVYNKGSQYSTINSYRSALSLILGKIMSDDLISRFCKGVYRLRPSLPRYNLTWDVNIVLNHLGNLFPHEQVSLETITKKCVTLMALVTAHRMQTISKIVMQNIVFSEDEILIKITDLIKTSRPGTAQPVLHLPYFKEKPQICPAGTLMAYIERTNSVRKSEKLFISFRKPYNYVTAQSLGRWVKCTLRDSGVDVSVFSSHSTRHASTSLAYKQGVSLDLIRNTAGWTGNSTTFARFYNRAIMKDQNCYDFAKSIINNNQ